MKVTVGPAPADRGALFWVKVGPRVLCEATRFCSRWGGQYKLEVKGVWETKTAILRGEGETIGVDLLVYKKKILALTR